MKYYRDIREYIPALEAEGKLNRVTITINKDTEMHPLVRWQFRGLPESERKAFIFENVTDARGKTYTIPVLLGCHAASRAIYALGMMCRPEEISEKWLQAELHPVEPKIVSHGPVQEEIHTGSTLLEHGGLDEFPIPISTPGFDPAPFLTAANWVSKDPETGGRNVGNYRAMVKARDRLGIFSGPQQHLGQHWLKCKDKGIPLQAAIVIGAPPSVAYVATVKVPYGVDEYSVAGGIAGAALELVKCKTVDIEVPAFAEIVIEGIVPTDYLELEAPFGEYPGYMGPRIHSQFFNITCITHRRNPIFNAFISQFPPNESSKLTGIGGEAVLYKFLKHDCAIPGIMEVALQECGGSHHYCVIRMKKVHPSSPLQALNGVVAHSSSLYKIAIVVDEDIDPRDAESVNWALSFRMQPHKDVRIVTGRTSALDPSSAPPGAPDFRYPSPSGNSSILIDATRKWSYPPVSLPKKEYMEHAKQIWEKLGFPALNAKVPWYGYNLGAWSKENEEEAELAVRGGYYETGEKLRNQRKEA